MLFTFILLNLSVSFVENLNMCVVKVKLFTYESIYLMLHIFAACSIISNCNEINNESFKQCNILHTSRSKLQKTFIITMDQDSPKM